MLGKNPHQRELPFGKKVLETMACGSRAFEPSMAYAQNWLASQLRVRASWVHQPAQDSYEFSVPRHRLVGSDAQITSAAKAVLGGHTKSAKDQDKCAADIAVTFTQSENAPAMVTISIPVALYRQMTVQHFFSTPVAKGR